VRPVAGSEIAAAKLSIPICIGCGSVYAGDCVTTFDARGVARESRMEDLFGRDSIYWGYVGRRQFTRILNGAVKGTPPPGVVMKE